MADFREQVRGQFAHIVVGVVGRVLKRDGDDLLVQAALVQHGDHADGIAAHQAQGLDDLTGEHQHIQRVVIICVSAGDQAIIGGIMRGGIEDAVQNQMARFLVQLVFLFAPFFDFDYSDKIVLGNAGRGNIMPDIAHVSHQPLGSLSVVL